ncbi:P-loop NTPase fold protein [Pseudoalteromonas distincta]|uniref:P-loop NTPase fold protein n=1 Tax=Pseudoalteromonas distincta TaxID=77608 RepID=UPI00241ED903|nr:P-loop NTPase fold protein [Pseudoalteromonas distincta]
MSQVKTLPITATRWLSLLLCAITAATITVFLSKVDFVQKAYSSWSAILHANPVLHYSSAFLAGIGIKLLLDKFYISHPKRDIGFSWRYPPVTMSLWLSVTIIGAILYFISNQEELIAATSCFEYFIVLILGSSIITAYQQSNERISLNLVVCFSLIAATSTAFIYWHISQIGFSWPLFITVDIYIFSAIFLIIKYINECIKAKWNRNQITLERTKNLSSGDFKTLDEFKSWFKDDSTIKSTEELEPDLQVYAKRITERLQNGGDKYEKNLAQHIALCGPYGCGKSSIVESIVNDLAKNSAKESVWIHSDISTWGAASGSVAHVVLSHIIDDISQYIDMCAFRALPKHYTEALKSGGSVFQFASTLLAGPVDIEGSFQKLNDVLDATNHKLLITLQDVDRGTGGENEKRLNDIAALLDRLKDKNLSNINFIVAMGNENEVAAEVISKATDYREDIVRTDISRILTPFIQEALKEAISPNGCVIILSHKSSAVRLDPKRVEDNFKIHTFSSRTEFILALEKRNSFFIEEVKALNAVIVSIRQLKKILRRVSQAWSSERLMGEVNLLSLLMICTLREVKPVYFSAFEKHYDFLIKSSSNNVVHIMRDLAEADDKVYFNFFKVLLGLTEEEVSGVNKKKKSPMDNDDQKVEALNRIADSFDAEINITEPKLVFNKYYRATQSLGCDDPEVCYLKRISREGVLGSELREQEVFSRFIKTDNLQSLASDLCHNLKVQQVVWRFEYVIFKKKKPISSTSTSEQLFELIIKIIRTNTYTNEALFISIFVKLVMQIINKSNLENVATDIACLSDPNLSLQFLNSLYDNSNSLENVLINFNFNQLGSKFLDSELSEEHLIILSKLNSLSQKRAGHAVDYEFILRLFLDRTDDKSLKLLVNVFKHDNNNPKLGINTDVKEVDIKEREKVIERLKRLDLDIKDLESVIHYLSLEKLVSIDDL